MKKLLAVLAGVTLAGVLALAPAVSASAHTGTLEVTQQCDAQHGNYVLSFHGHTSSVPDSGAGHTATLTVGELTAGAVADPATQQVVGNAIYSFTVTLRGDAKAAQATAFLVWGDGAKSDPQGKITLAGDCQPAKPQPKVDVKKEDSADCKTHILTTTTTTTTTDYKLVDNAWVEDTPVVKVEVTTSVIPRDRNECKPKPPTPPTCHSRDACHTSTPHPAVKELAHTGGKQDWTALPLAGGLLFVGAGSLLFGKRFSGKRSE